jgi:hypothetical protein
MRKVYDLATVYIFIYVWDDIPEVPLINYYINTKLR